MKKNVLFLLAVICLMITLPAASQKYKSESDTLKLNKELVEVSNEVASLTAELTIAQNNLPGYLAKGDKAKTDAARTAQQSSDQADKATNGELKDAKTAKKKAKKALNDAEDSEDAKHSIEKQEKKIDKLTAQLQKKQKTLLELEEMRTAIRMMHQ
jgi:CHASE3 domain sensor protein